MKYYIGVLAVSFLIFSVPSLAIYRESISIYFHLLAEDTLPVAEQGLYAVRDIQLARQALLQDEIPGAHKFIDEAARLLTEQSTDWEKYTRKNPHSSLSHERYVVINRSLHINDKLLDECWKQTIIYSGNEKLLKSYQGQVITERCLGGIQMIQNTFLLPLQKTQKAVADARQLLIERKYSEASWVLKVVEESIMVERIIVN